ncbi:hypothetical protein SAMN05216474_2349 [Lishizhenia tianjinensis]|uniref:Uncharacterized protein n=1 Tax=Lishizhenia tianjinensis TaxID=477690 RepID=A0A1I7AWE6_9FLAO|nr:hypothetical protein SAMN05216474_2349 [Lishizhenia tianjinensis]
MNILPFFCAYIFPYIGEILKFSLHLARNQFFEKDEKTFQFT